MFEASPKLSGLRALLSLIGFAVVIACYFYDPVLGVRALGIDALVVSAVSFRSGRIPYGVRGQPPAGHLTGGPAIFGGIVLAVIGLACLFAPHRVLPLLGSRKFSKPL